MKEKERVILWTSLAAGVFCVELIGVTLTPLAGIGNGTRFGSEGMYYNLMMGGGSYVLPLVLYCLNIKAMKYVIACVNALWLICHPAIMGICAAGALNRGFTPLGRLLCLAGAALGLAGLVFSILWYPMCRRKRK